MEQIIFIVILSNPSLSKFMNPKVIFFPVIAFASLVILIGLFRGEHSIASYFALRESQTVLAEAVDKLKQENSGLEQEILKLKKSKSYAKKVLRDKYHITDEGEKIIFFAD
ncbi:MAG: septum formation initiator family protein [Bdellovibrionota bacterium]